MSRNYTLASLIKAQSNFFSTYMHNNIIMKQTNPLISLCTEFRYRVRTGYICNIQIAYICYIQLTHMGYIKCTRIYRLHTKSLQILNALHIVYTQFIHKSHKDYMCYIEIQFRLHTYKNKVYVRFVHRLYIAS